MNTSAMRQADPPAAGRAPTPGPAAGPASPALLTQPLGFLAIAWRTLAFLLAFAILHELLGQAAHALMARGIAVDWNETWPAFLGWHDDPDQLITRYAPRAAVAILAFAVALRLLPDRPRLGVVALLGAASLLASNLIQGVQAGLVLPITSAPARSIEYYDDAFDQLSASTFLAQFNDLQWHLRCHSQTHPPGAVLFFRPFIVLGVEPAAIAVAIALLATALASIGLYFLVEKRVGPSAAAWTVLLFLAIPSVQIYFCATLDAVMCGLFVCTVCAAVRIPGRRGIVAVAAALFAASFLTFAATFLGPVLLAVEWIERRSVRRTLAAFGLVALAYLVLKAIWGFDYLESFSTAAQVENQQGVLLLSAPASYVVTRLEDVAEIVLFLGPFVGALVLHGLRTRTSGADENARRIALACVATVLLMFATGAFKTGETARACQFLLPFLMLPLARPIATADPQALGLLVLLALGQGAVMQAVASY